MKCNRLRSYMLRNRVFLHLLFTDKKSNTTQRLTVCTNVQANVVLHILHKIVTGEIPIKKADFLALKKTRKLNHLKKIETKSGLQVLLKSSREKKIAFLKQFTTLYSKLFKVLFLE